MGWGTFCNSGFEIRRVNPKDIPERILSLEERGDVLVGAIKALAAYSPASVEDLEQQQRELESLLQEYSEASSELALLYVAKTAGPGELEEL